MAARTRAVKSGRAPVDHTGMKLRLYPTRVERPAPPAALTQSQALWLAREGPRPDHAEAGAVPVGPRPARRARGVWWRRVAARLLRHVAARGSPRR